MVWSSSRARNILNSTSSPDNTRLITEGLLSSGQSSEGEFVEGEEKPWPPLRFSRSRDKRQEPRPPRPHSHLFRTKDGRSRGSKHTRRWENCRIITSTTIEQTIDKYIHTHLAMYLSSLHGIPEEESVTINPTHNSPLTKLHTSDKHMQIWYSYTSSGEANQSVETATIEDGGSEGVMGVGGEGVRGGGGGAVRGEEAYRRIDRRIRSILTHNKHIPMGLVDDVEEELRELFSLDSTSVVILLQTNAFCRLLFHGVSQYLGLMSTTEVFEGVSVMIVECRSNHFHPPSTTLLQHYQQR